MRLPTSIPAQTAALLAITGLCALLANAVAGPRRHLAWFATPMTAPPIAPLIAEPISATIPAAIPTPAQPTPALPTPAQFPKAPTLKPTPSEVPTPQTPSQPVREIASAEAWAVFQAGAPFLDARRSADFEAGHIKGAFNLSVWESTLDEHLVEFEAKTNRPPEAPLVLYCSGGGCEDSHLLASRLFKMGYRNLLIYRDGYPDWQANGRPVAAGAK
ncbi:MAG: rhodanese-like domain-containing protein [Holophaga sp.]|nr:rhodanese-like domain-containing protein [Holophaga sp.]